MINAVEIINHSGEMLRCVLEDPESSGFSIYKIDGLGPGKATLNSKELAGMDGGIITNSKMPIRNIVLYFALHDYYHGRYQTIEQSRQRLYDLFPIKYPVTLIIETDIHRYKISGQVESNEPDIFSPNETMQVSVLCPMPYYTLDDPDSGESGEIEQIVFTSSGLFEFPIDDPDTEEEEPEGLYNPVHERTILFGVESSDNDRWATLNYAGDIDVGVIFRLKILSIGTPNYIWIRYFGNSESNDEVSWLRFSNIGYRAIPNGGLQNDDELIISTVSGNKYAIIKRGTETINVLSFIQLKGGWLKFKKGSNVLRLQLGTILGDTPTNVFATITYQELFAGV